MNIIKAIKHSMPLKILIPILIISIASVVSFAASVAVNSSTSQTVQGVMYTVVGGFTAANNGFVVTQSPATASTIPATWTNGGTVTTSTVAGNWQYSLTVTLNAAASTSTTYTVTVQWNTGSGYTTLATPLTFTTPSTITAGQTMTFVFNTGVTTFNAPAGLLITIA
jgi:hypothetical protein